MRRLAADSGAMSPAVFCKENGQREPQAIRRTTAGARVKIACPFAGANVWARGTLERFPKDLHFAFILDASVGAPMSMRDEYRTKAVEFQARARCESDGRARFHFESLARDYLRLAELAVQVDAIYKRPKIDNSRKPARLARRS